MPITFKNRDISTLISGGTNNQVTSTTDTDGRVCMTGIPTGESTKYPWENPYPFGITIGNKDLSTMYRARFTDYRDTVNNINIPDGVNAVKVFCIGGGGGGAGGNGGHRNTHRKRGNCSGSNMNRNWNWNSPYCNYYDEWDAPVTGNLGAYGKYGEHKMGEFGRDGNTFTIQIGNGGHGGGGGEWRRGDNGTAGGSGGSGNATQFIMGGKTLISNGGGGGYGTLGNWLPTTTNPQYNTPSGTPEYSSQGGNAGQTSHNNGNSGGTGNKGFCRVYFLY